MSIQLIKQIKDPKTQHITSVNLSTEIYLVLDTCNIVSHGIKREIDSLDGCDYVVEFDTVREIHDLINSLLTLTLSIEDK